MSLAERIGAHDRYDGVARPRPLGDVRAAGRRIDLHAGRSQKPLRSRDFLGLQPASPLTPGTWNVTRPTVPASSRPEDAATARWSSVDAQPTATSRVSDLVIRIESGQDFEVFWALRALVRGLPLERRRIGGVPRDVIEDLCRRMIGCRSGDRLFRFRPGPAAGSRIWPSRACCSS